MVQVCCSTKLSQPIYALQVYICQSGDLRKNAFVQILQIIYTVHVMALAVMYQSNNKCQICCKILHRLQKTHVDVW